MTITKIYVKLGDGKAALNCADLPPCPPSKIGWPWTFNSDDLREVAPPSKAFPRISVVTPSFNQGQFIEETVRSVLLQAYPNLEYIVIDGGSTDASVEIIRKYEPWISYWVSEKDCGQSHAINKGFKRATGDIIAWVNSDDLYLPGALAAVADFFRNNPHVSVVYGETLIVDGQSNTLWSYGRGTPDGYVGLDDWVTFWWRECPAAQQGIFFRRELLNKVGYFDERMHYCFDYDYWLRIAESEKFYYLPKVLAKFRIHSASKTSNYKSGFIKEGLASSKRYWGSKRSLKYWRYLLSSWVSLYSVWDASDAVKISKENRLKALGLLLKAIAICPVAPFVKPAPFLTALLRIVFGWGALSEHVKRSLVKYSPRYATRRID